MNWQSARYRLITGGPVASVTSPSVWKLGQNGPSGKNVNFPAPGNCYNSVLQSQTAL